MNCPFCNSKMTDLAGKDASLKLLGAMMAPTSAAYNMAKGGVSNQSHVKGAHCNGSNGCGYLALFLTR